MRRATEHKGDCSFDEDLTNKDETESDGDEETCVNDGQSSSNEATDGAQDKTSEADEADYAGAESEASGSRAPSTNRPESCLIMEVARRHRQYVLAVEGHHKKIKEALTMRSGDQLEIKKVGILGEVMIEVLKDFEEIASDELFDAIVFNSARATKWMLVAQYAALFEKIVAYRLQIEGEPPLTGAGRRTYFGLEGRLNPRIRAVHNIDTPLKAIRAMNDHSDKVKVMKKLHMHHEEWQLLSMPMEKRSHLVLAELVEMVQVTNKDFITPNLSRDEEGCDNAPANSSLYIEVMADNAHDEPGDDDSRPNCTSDYAALMGLTRDLNGGIMPEQMTRILPITASADLKSEQRASHEIEDRHLAKSLTINQINKLATQGVGAILKRGLRASRKYDAGCTAACKEAKLNFDEAIGKRYCHDSGDPCTCPRMASGAVVDVTEAVVQTSEPFKERTLQHFSTEACFTVCVWDSDNVKMVGTPYGAQNVKWNTVPTMQMMVAFNIDEYIRATRTGAIEAPFITGMQASLGYPSTPEQGLVPAIERRVSWQGTASLTPYL